MAEPEDVIAEGALAATRAIRELWARRTAGMREGPPRLHDLRRRLELFLAAVLPDTPEIGVADPPAPPSFLARLARRRTAHLHSRTALSSTDGRRIRLPPSLDDLPPALVPGRYRLLVLEQGFRARRGRPARLPADRLARDLFLLAEAAVIDRLLVRMLPRLEPALREARLEALESRPLAPRASARELAVEALVRALLRAHVASPPPPFVMAETPEDSRRWGEEERPGLMKLPGPYRGIAPVPLWGELAFVPESPLAAGQGDWEGAPPGRARTLPRRPRIRRAGEEEDDEEPGTWMVRADDLQEKAEDPAGLQRPADRDQHADPGELADALSELPELRLVRSPDVAREVLAGDDPIPRAPGPERPAPASGIAYPEWDWRAGAYHLRGAIVRERAGEGEEDAWVESALRRHAAMIRAVRRDFERLRPRRTALRRQPDGSELDVDAVVAAFADRRGGGASDERFYIDNRPRRRDAAITLLVDASASTDGWVSGDRRIIDVEKEALLIVSEALAALGDPHAILSFSGHGPARVDIRVLRRFDDRAGPAEVRRRIAGLEPEGYTRAGAAIRHATSRLMRQAARHRLLLLLSDGRPNDVDLYEGRYGIEDTRMAVAEARLQGVGCFCLTVDREAPRYASRIFGRGLAVLPGAERLPAVLTAVLRDLIQG